LHGKHWQVSPGVQVAEGSHIGIDEPPSLASPVAASGALGDEAF
jgi:hypothetical protein